MAQSTRRKDELVARLDDARARVAGHSRGVRAHLHPGEKLRALFKRQRLGWLGGAAVLGLLLAKLPPRMKKVPVRRGKKGKDREQLANAGKAGLTLGVLKLVLDLAKPILIAWATKRMGDVAKTTQRTEQKVARTEHKVSKVEQQTT
ncbi:MAG TPA: hypothetical protein VFV83_03535 [Chthoniobacteraceae bacterium]|nr:hypothetical protein [Chthoniobacteraceae bacterium]